jgi:hypothetical protein
VADADADHGDREGLERRVQRAEGPHPRDPALPGQRLARVGARAERARIGRGQHEAAQPLVGRQLREGVVEARECARVEGIAALRTVDAQDRDPVRAPLEDDRHGRGAYTWAMRSRVFSSGLTALVFLALTAPVALAQNSTGHDGGEGWWGETNDKVVTNFGFFLIAFFPCSSS